LIFSICRLTEIKTGKAVCYRSFNTIWPELAIESNARIANASSMSGNDTNPDMIEL